LNPLDRDEGFQITSSLSSLPGLFLAQHPQTFTDVDTRAGSALARKRTSARGEYLYCLAPGLNEVEIIPSLPYDCRTAKIILHWSAI